MDNHLEAVCKEIEVRDRSIRRLDRTLPTLARLDVRSAHTLTSRLVRPYDPRFGAAIQSVARRMLVSRKAAGAFCQSDEITLLWPALNPSSRSELDFGGRTDKWLSTLAGEASVCLDRELRLATITSRIPHMDCRLMQPRTRDEMVALIEWRYRDAVRNGVLGAAQEWIGRKRVHGLSERMLRSRLETELADQWNTLPEHAREGTFMVRERVERPLTPTEWERVPEHRRNDIGLVTRTVVRQVPYQEFLERFCPGGADGEQ